MFMQIKRRNGFRKGSSTFKCGVCTRLTRETGEQAMGSELCPECWEIAGIENEIADGICENVADALAEIETLKQAAIAKGGVFE